MADRILRTIFDDGSVQQMRKQVVPASNPETRRAIGCRYSKHAVWPALHGSCATPYSSNEVRNMSTAFLLSPIEMRRGRQTGNTCR